MKPALIFDFDDTLVDSYFASVYASRVLDVYGKYRFGVDNFGKTFDKFDIAMTKKTHKTKNVNLLKRQHWAKLTAKKLKLKLSEHEDEHIAGIYWNAILQSLRVFPGVTQTLSKLQKKYDLYILSDVDGDARIKVARMKSVGLYKFFKGFSLGDVLKTTKPDKKYYSYIVRKYKLNPKTSVMIGDRPTYDLEPAKKFGMKTIWIKQGRWKTIYGNKRFKYVDNSINDIRELLKIL